MRFRHLVRPALAGLAAVAVAAGVAAPAGAPQFAALAGIEPGQWQLKETGGDAPRLLCLGDPRALLQIRHGAAVCSRYVITDTARSAVVHYTCPGAGHGRTTITIETPRLFKLQTQGIAEGAPFQMDYEARRTGTCSAGEGGR